MTDLRKLRKQENYHDGVLVDFVNNEILEYWIEPHNFRMNSQVLKHQVWVQ